MILNGVQIDDTFAEAFPMKATRIIITAQSQKWAYEAALAMTGFATSVIACGCEAGIERELSPRETPDGRPGISVLIFAMGRKGLAKQLSTRVGQCVLTTPTTAVYAGIGEGESLPLGQEIRFFGDGYQVSRVIAGRRFWRVPVMDGEFLAEETTGMVDGIGGGNFLILATSQSAALAACEAAVAAMKDLPDTILPFPGGVVRSGSKVGSKHKGLGASTNTPFCPTLKGVVRSELSPEVESVMEIVIDGLSFEAIAESMRRGIEAACALGRGQGIVRISAGNYGGKLGPYHFRLWELLRG